MIEIWFSRKLDIVPLAGALKAVEAVLRDWRVCRLELMLVGGLCIETMAQLKMILSVRPEKDRVWTVYP